MRLVHIRVFSYDAEERGRCSQGQANAPSRYLRKWLSAQRMGYTISTTLFSIPPLASQPRLFCCVAVDTSEERHAHRGARAHVHVMVSAYVHVAEAPFYLNVCTYTHAYIHVHEFACSSNCSETRTHTRACVLLFLLCGNVQ